MSLRFRLSRAARELKPLQQGDLDGLCGLYAIINAVQLALYPQRKLRRRELKQLFDCGLGVLGRTRRLRTILTQGMRASLWNRLCDAVLAEAADLVGCTVVRSSILLDQGALDARDAVRRIKRSLRMGNPVLVALLGSYNHTTVIVSFSATRFSLFDSYRRRWIWIRSMTFDPMQSDKPHFIPLPSVVAVTIAPAPAAALEVCGSDHVG